MGNFGLNGGIPWITNTDDVLCFVCKRDTETLGHFLFDCPDFQEHFDSLRSNLCLEVSASNRLDGEHIVSFLAGLDQHEAILLLWCIPLPFDSSTVIGFITSAIGKIDKLRTERLHELSWGSMANKLVVFSTGVHFLKVLILATF